MSWVGKTTTSSGGERGREESWRLHPHPHSHPSLTPPGACLLNRSQLAFRLPPVFFRQLLAKNIASSVDSTDGRSGAGADGEHGVLADFGTFRARTNDLRKLDPSLLSMANKIGSMPVAEYKMVLEAEGLGTEGGARAVRTLIDVPAGMMLRAAPEQLFRVLANLVRNARQAIEATGRPGTVEVSAAEDDAEWRLRVGDDGPGLPERARAHLFAPFQGGVRQGGAGLGLALVEAIYSLKKRDIEVNVVFTVVDGAYGEILKQEIVSRDLGRQVTIVGRVSPEKMGVFYRQSAFVVVPSLFEQNSGPVLEAIHFGKAVAVSNIKEVELTLAGAGLLFDPHSVQQIADAIDQLWSSSAALAEAEASIQRRNAEMSWEPFRRVYRQAYAYALGR